jgi:Tol biopolymer transport system component
LVNLNDGQDPYPEAQHEAAVQLAAYLVTKYNIEVEDIVAHADVALPAGRKTDPRGYDMDRLRQDVAALVEKQTQAASGEKATPPPVSAPYPRLVYVQTSTENTWDHATAIISGEDGEVLEHLVVDAAAPAWSPDGEQIAYFREKSVPELLDLYGEPGAGIYVVDARGKNPRRLRQVENVRSLMWSPDGSKLAVEVAPPGREDHEHEVLIIDAGDGRTVASFQGQYPTWGPNGEKLVIRDYNGLWQVNLQGEREDQLTQEGSDQLPYWSPDGQHLAFGSQGRDGDWEIYVLRFSDRSISRLTERPGTDTVPVFSPDGQEIYFLAQYGPIHWTIEAIRLDGQSGPRVVKEGVGGSDLRGLMRPAVQP